jgi:hypothetical protein
MGYIPGTGGHVIQWQVGNRCLILAGSVWYSEQVWEDEDPKGMSRLFFAGLFSSRFDHRFGCPLG